MTWNLKKITQDTTFFLYDFLVEVLHHHGPQKSHHHLSFSLSIFLSMWRGPIGLPIVANRVAKMKKITWLYLFLIKEKIIIQSSMKPRSRWGYIIIGALFVLVYLPDLEGSCTISIEIHH